MTFEILTSNKYSIDSPDSYSYCILGCATVWTGRKKYNFEEPTKPYSVKKMEGRTSLINVSALLPDYMATNFTEQSP
jgi:hypothetical protein